MARLGSALPLEDLTEKEWMAQCSQLAKTMGWRRYHTFRSDRSPPGWPDDALVRDRLILLEYKTEKGRLSDAQKDWIRALLNAQVEVYVCRPRHLEQLAEILRYRDRSIGPPFASPLALETRALVALDQ